LDYPTRGLSECGSSVAEWSVDFWCEYIGAQSFANLWQVMIDLLLLTAKNKDNLSTGQEYKRSYSIFVDIEAN
jgi:hypothetical protein